MTHPASFSLEAPPLPPPFLSAPRASCYFRAPRRPFLFEYIIGCLKWAGDPNLSSESAKPPFASQSFHAAMPGRESFRQTMKTPKAGCCIGAACCAPLLMLFAVEHCFGVACTRQGGSKADNDHNVADRISALSVGSGCARADAVGTFERGAVPPCVLCVCRSPAACCKVTGHVRGICSPQKFTLGHFLHSWIPPLEHGPFRLDFFLTGFFWSFFLLLVESIL